MILKLLFSLQNQKTNFIRKISYQYEFSKNHANICCTLYFVSKRSKSRSRVSDRNQINATWKLLSLLIVVPFLCYLFFFEFILSTVDTVVFRSSISITEHSLLRIELLFFYINTLQTILYFSVHLIFLLQYKRLPKEKIERSNMVYSIQPRQ